MNQKQYLSTTMEYHTNRSCQRERQPRELISISGLPPSEYVSAQTMMLDMIIIYTTLFNEVQHKLGGSAEILIDFCGQEKSLIFELKPTSWR